MDAYTVAKACLHFGLANIDGNATLNAPSALHHLHSDESRYTWLLEQAKAVRKQLLSPDYEQQWTEIDHMSQQASGLEQRQHILQTMQQENGKFKCLYCGKVYVREGNFSKHLKKVHFVDLDTTPADSQNQDVGSGEACSNAMSVISSFCRMGQVQIYRRCLSNG